MSLMGPCKSCGKDIDPSRVFGEIYTCESCGHSGPLPSIKDRRKFKSWALAIGTALGAVGGYFAFDNYKSELVTRYNGLQKVSSVEYKISKMTQREAAILKDSCSKAPADYGCLAMVYKRLLEFDNSNVDYRANRAMAFTEIGRHEEAIKIYQSLIDKGVSTYDLMAYYGDSLAAVNKTEDAIDWYKRALTVAPSLVDTVEKLARLYVKMGDKPKAKKTLRSFIKQNPESRIYLKGSLIGIDLAK